MTTTPNDPGGYGGGGYGGAPSYGTPGGNSSASNPMAIGSLVAGVLSILALCAAIIPFVGPIFGLIVGVVAIFLAISARKKVRAGTAGQGGLAKAGLITGIIGTVLNVIVLILTIAGVAAFGGAIENCSDPNLTTEEQQTCLEQEIGG